MGHTRKTLVIIVTVCVTFFLSGHFISKYYNRWAMSQPKKYCYDYYNINRQGNNVVNTALYVKNKSDLDSLITYYREREKGNKNAYINFPLFGFPTDTCVYVLGYKKDSLIAKVICYSDLFRSYKVGYVYTGTLHDTPAPPKRKENDTIPN